MANKTIVAAIAVVAVVSVAGLFYPKSVFNAGSSAVGSSFNSAKIAATNISLAAAGATSTAIRNTDASDRIVTEAFATCSGIGTSLTAYTGTGLVALKVDAATSSTSVISGNSNDVFGSGGATIATSTPTDAFTNNTTFATAFTRRWAAGSYLVFSSNATNTAACTVGVKYLAT